MRFRAFIFLGLAVAALGGFAAASACPHERHGAHDGVRAAMGARIAASDDRQCHHNHPASQSNLAALVRPAPGLPAPAVSNSSVPGDPLFLHRQTVPAADDGRLLARLRRDAPPGFSSVLARNSRLLI